MVLLYDRFLSKQLFIAVSEQKEREAKCECLMMDGVKLTSPSRLSRFSGCSPLSPISAAQYMHPPLPRFRRLHFQSNKLWAFNLSCGSRTHNPHARFIHSFPPVIFQQAMGHHMAFVNLLLVNIFARMLSVISDISHALCPLPVFLVIVILR